MVVYRAPEDGHGLNTGCRELGGCDVLYAVLASEGGAARARGGIGSAAIRSSYRARTGGAVRTAAVMAPLEIPRQISMEDFGRLRTSTGAIMTKSYREFWRMII
jgi:hypothetical protein